MHGAEFGGGGRGRRRGGADGGGGGGGARGNGAEALTERVSAVVVDCFSINDVDASALRMLRDLRKELGERKVALLLAALKGPVRDVLERDGLVGAGESVDRAFVTLHEAVKHAARLHCVRCGVARVPGANRV